MHTHFAAIKSASSKSQRRCILLKRIYGGKSESAPLKMSQDVDPSYRYPSLDLNLSLYVSGAFIDSLKNH